MNESSPPNAPRPIPFSDALKVWLRIAALSFGGPAGQIAVMHRILVDEKRWISEERFLHALNFCMLLPGPEAQQMATYFGWLLHRVKGGIVAGILFILPGFLSIMVLSVLYAEFQQTTIVPALFYGLKPAVMAIVVEALVRIARRILKNRILVLIAALSFLAIFLFNLPFPAIVALTATGGYVGARLLPEAFGILQDRTAVDAPPTAASDDAAGQSETKATEPLLHAIVIPTTGFRQSLRTTVIAVIFWVAPLIAVSMFLPREQVLMTEGQFFSQTAVVTFGGAYGVLAYIKQQAVDVHNWLEPHQMLDGLGMAETTPGPLIMVVQFVGFMGGYRQTVDLPPLWGGILGACITTWVTFVPCFLWIFLGGPYVERIRNNQRLSAALKAITASVVGVILNLAVWFSLQTLFQRTSDIQIGWMKVPRPDFASVDLGAILIAAVAFLLIFRFRRTMVVVLPACCGLGILWKLFL